MQLIPSPDSAPKLTNWAKEPSLLQLKTDLDMSKPAHDAMVRKIQAWTALLNVKNTPKKKGRSSVQPKLIRRQAEWRYPALSEPFLSSNKLFNVKPTSWEDEAAAKQNELVLNWQFRTKINRVRFIDNFVRATVDEGTSILRVGWDRQTVEVTEKAPVYTYYAITEQTQLEQLQQVLDLKESNPQEYNNTVPENLKEAVSYFEETGQAVYAVQTGTTDVKTEKVVMNRPTVEVLNPQNFYLDPTCDGDITKALFAVVSFETNKAELQKNPSRYKNLDRVNWETANPVTETDHASKITDQQFADTTRKRVVAYEYWGFYDITGTGVLEPIVCTWIGDVIVRMERNPFPDQKLPFIMVPYLPVKRDAYGEPDAELLEDNQAILGAVMRGMIDLLGRSANSQRGMAKGMLDPLNKRKYENGDDYEFNPQQNPQNSIVEHKFPELPQSAMLMINLQNQEAEALTGVKSFSGGMSSKAFGDVAAGMDMVLDAASKREMSILRRLAQGIVEVGMKFASMNAVFLSEQEVVRVTNKEYVQLSPAQKEGAKAANDETQDMFVTVNREDLEGNFDTEVDVSTAEVDNAKSQDLSFMVQTIGPNAGTEVTLMLLAEIADLKRMPALGHKLRNFQPTPDPVQEKLKELEIKRLEAEIAELESRKALNEAKAGEAVSKRDLTDLDYVEQETGTKHARQLDAQGAQARANQDLEITKALVKPRKEGESKPDIEAGAGYNDVTEERARANTTLPPMVPVDNFSQSQPLPELPAI